MIRRETENGWIIFSQYDHSRLSAEIMSHWENKEFSSIKPLREVLFSIAEHDSGWVDHDENPVINPETGYPMNFIEVPLKEKHRIWTKCFTKHMETHPYASGLIALHFRWLNHKMLEKNPKEKTLLEMNSRIEKFVSNTLNIQIEPYSWDLPLEIKTNLRFLQLGDLLSLVLCHGWNKEKMRNVPMNYENKKTEIEIFSSDGYDYLLSKNPFSVDTLQVQIEGKRLEQKIFRNEKELRTALSKTEKEYFHYTIRTA